MKKILFLLFWTMGTLAQGPSPNANIAGLVSSDGGATFSFLSSADTAGGDVVTPNVNGVLLGYNSTTHQFYYCSTANPCTGTGGGGSYLPLAGGTLTGPLIGTSAAFSSGISSTSDGVHAGISALAGNTTAPAIPSNSFGWIGFASASATSYFFQPPTTAPSGTQVMMASTPSSGVSPVTYLNPTNLTTTTQCLAATTVNTPCLAYTNHFTGLNNTGTSGTITLYTSNSPANAQFQFCPNIFISAVAGAGNVALTITFTTPGNYLGGGATFGFLTTSLTSQYGPGNTCVTIPVAANTTLSFVVAASGASGATSSWETDPVVTRLN